jgi:uncharacterized membrane protein YtjA (UPF0391 family)
VIGELLAFIGSFLGFGTGEAGAASPRIARILVWIAVIVMILLVAWAISLLF